MSKLSLRPNVHHFHDDRPDRFIAKSLVRILIKVQINHTLRSGRQTYSQFITIPEIGSKFNLNIYRTHFIYQALILLSRWGPRMIILVDIFFLNFKWLLKCSKVSLIIFNYNIFLGLDVKIIKRTPPARHNLGINLISINFNANFNFKNLFRLHLKMYTIQYLFANHSLKNLVWVLFLSK